MMDNKKIEKYIEQALNSEKPNRRVLSEAKNIMAQKQRQLIKKTWRYCVAAASSACLLVLGIIASIFSEQDLYLENESNVALEQTTAIQPNDIWFIVSIISISIAIIIGIVTIIIKIKNTKWKK